MKKLLSVVFMMVLCASAVSAISLKKRQKYVDSHPTLSLVVREAILAREAVVGETVEDVLTTFGRPDTINRMSIGNGVQEQWVLYIEHLMSNKANETIFIYFEGGVVTSWQD